MSEALVYSAGHSKDCFNHPFCYTQGVQGGFLHLATALALQNITSKCQACAV